MSERTAGAHVPGDFGHGALGRITAALYRYIVLTVLLALTCLPTLVLMVLLDHSWSNAPFAILSAVFVGPALSATLYAVRDHERASDEGLAPARAFWRGYRQNAVDVTRVWLPALVLLAVVTFVLANAGAAGISGAYVVVLAVIAVLVLTWALHAVAIASFFGFRTRDVARLAAYYLGRYPLVALGVVSLVVAAGGVVLVGTEVALAVLGVAWVWCWARNDARMLDDVRDRFTTEGAAPATTSATEPQHEEPIAP